MKAVGTAPTDQETIGSLRRERRTPGRLLKGVAAAGSLLLAVACGNEGGTAAQSENSPASRSASATPSKAGVALVLDSLGPPPVIQVYPGAGTEVADRQLNGTYSDGQVVLADCQTEGRSVTYDPPGSAAPRTSATWYLIQHNPMPDQYLSKVFTEPNPAAKQLPPC